MAARLITAPVAAAVTLTEVKALIRVTDPDEDTVVQAMIDAAVGMLDGRGGLLGRAIMAQVWAEDLALPGPWVLALPDIEGASLVATLDGVAVDAGALTVGASEGGPLLELSGLSGAVLAVQYSCALPAAKLKTAKVLISLIVDYWYGLRSAGQEDGGLPGPALGLIAQLRWHGV